MKLVKYSALFLGACLSGMTAMAQAPKPAASSSENPSQIYLSCPSPNEPDGVRDLHVDFGTRKITNSFGISYPFREEGPFLIAESFQDNDPSKPVNSTYRINRYTGSYTYTVPVLRLHSSHSCQVTEKKL